MQVFIDNVSHHARHQRNIRPGCNGKMDIGIVGNCRSPGIDHNDGRSIVRRFVDFPHNNGVTFRCVGADDKNTVRSRKIFNRVRHGSASEGLNQTHRGRSVSETGTMIDVIRLEARPDQLLKKIIFLIGTLGRRKSSDSVATVFVGDFRKFFSCNGQCFIP